MGSVSRPRVRESGYADDLGALQRWRPDTEARIADRHSMMVDDKLRILTATKAVVLRRLTTDFPRQGHHALDPAAVAACPSGDRAIERIGDPLHIDIRAALDTR